MLKFKTNNFLGGTEIMKSFDGVPNSQRGLLMRWLWIPSFSKLVGCQPRFSKKIRERSQKKWHTVLSTNFWKKKKIRLPSQVFVAKIYWRLYCSWQCSESNPILSIPLDSNLIAVVFSAICYYLLSTHLCRRTLSSG